jgi:hypothetical protein
MALGAAGGDRAQADGKQGHGAVDGQGDTGGGVLCPARRGGRDDKEEAVGELARGARRRKVAAGVLGGGIGQSIFLIIFIRNTERCICIPSVSRMSVNCHG